MLNFSQRFGGGFPKWFALLFCLVLCCLVQTDCAVRKRMLPLREPVEFDKEDYRLIWPLPIVTTARFTSTYGRRKDPITGMSDFHTGIDIDGEKGTPVHASGAGKVVFNGWRRGYGLLLIIDHGNGLTTYYGHCSRLFVNRGDKVNRGQIVALMGDTGRTTGSHLHFETRKHGYPFDPCLLLPKLKKM